MENVKDPNKEWYDKTLTLLLTTSIPVSRICRDTMLSHRWLNKLMVGEIPNPSVNRINLLFNYLSDNQR